MVLSVYVWYDWICCLVVKTRHSRIESNEKKRTASRVVRRSFQFIDVDAVCFRLIVRRNQSKHRVKRPLNGFSFAPLSFERTNVYCALWQIQRIRRQTVFEETETRKTTSRQSNRWKCFVRQNADVFNCKMIHNTVSPTTRRTMNRIIGIIRGNR